MTHATIANVAPRNEPPTPDPASPSRSSPEGGGAGRLTAALLIASLLTAGLALVAEADRRSERREVLRELAPLPAAERQRAERWDRPDRMRLEVARRLVNQTLETPAEVETALPLARRLAARVLARRPASWRASALLGASLYLERSLARDPRVVTQASRWETPLVHAREMAPHALAPGRFQAIAYLELWPYLPADRRTEAQDLLRRAFEHGPTFRRLLGPWLEIAEDREQALAVIPDRVEAWQRLQDELAPRPGDAGDPEGYLEARRRWRSALEQELGEALEAAARTRRAGDPYRARHLYLDVIARAPAERRYVPYVERALAEAPPGPALSEYSAKLGRWLDWALDLDLVGSSPLSAEAVERLASQVVDLPAPRAAHAAVVAGQLPEGERLERRTAFRRDPAWGGYRLAKARELTARGRGEEALATLAELPPSWQDRPSTLQIRRNAAATAGREQEERQAAAALGRWGSEGEVQWLEEDRARGELVVPPDRRSVRVRGEVGGRGRRSGAAAPALLELHLDGELVATRRVTGGGAELPLPQAPPGAEGGPPGMRLHLLEVAPVGGVPFRPTGLEIVVPGSP